MININQSDNDDQPLDDWELLLKSNQPALDASFASRTLYEAGYRVGVKMTPRMELMQSARVLAGFFGGIVASLLVTIFIAPSWMPNKTGVAVRDQQATVELGSATPQLETLIEVKEIHPEIKDISSFVDHALAGLGQLNSFAVVESQASGAVPPTEQPILNYGQIIQGLNSGEIRLN